MEGERVQMGNEREGLERHLGQLKEDLATMTKENQAVHSELRKVVEERDRVKEKVDEYARNVLKYEELLSAKVSELESDERTDSLSIISVSCIVLLYL